MMSILQVLWHNYKTVYDDLDLMYITINHQILKLFDLNLFLSLFSTSIREIVCSISLKAKLFWRKRRSPRPNVSYSANTDGIHCFCQNDISKTYGEQFARDIKWFFAPPFFVSASFECSSTLQFLWKEQTIPAHVCVHFGNQTVYEDIDVWVQKTITKSARPPASSICSCCSEK